MEDYRKRLVRTEEELNHLVLVKDGTAWANLSTLQMDLATLRRTFYELPEEELDKSITVLEAAVAALCKRCDDRLSPMERVHIVRSPYRFSLRDILENIYDDYSILGGADDINIDPALVAAKAMVLRRVHDKTFSHQVMVIGHEKGHGEEFRNGGSCKPWGNEKALRFMRVAETEGIPIHFYIFTPGAFPVEEYPGAAQQIAANLYAMTTLKVPMVSVISEGGSGGAEALGLSDYRLMLSHGYYSVISPEGAAAIEGRVREGERLPDKLVETCAERLCITAEDNLRLGTIDRIVQEPVLGARRDDFSFFRQLRYEMIRATDEVVLKTKSLRAFRAYELKSSPASPGASIKNLENLPVPVAPEINVSWDLDENEIRRLIFLRAEKYRFMAVDAFKNDSGTGTGLFMAVRQKTAKVYYGLRYGFFKKHRKQAQKLLHDVSGEGSVFFKQLIRPFSALSDALVSREKSRMVQFQAGVNTVLVEEFGDTYVSPLANRDRAVSCPNRWKNGCKDLWVPDLYSDFCGVCENCGHHFPLEYEWYLQHIFDQNSIREFNDGFTAANPLKHPELDAKLARARRITNRKSSMMTFKAGVSGIECIVAMPFSEFRNGTVGAAEGEKFVQACEMAQLQRKPLLAYVHSTGGIRIQEGTMGVVQMPKCTMAVRRYVDSGGLYIVVYDNNSYAGPVASFLGCSHYQFAIRSSRIGFAGPRVIRETTGQDIAPDYHSAANALLRGHIHDVWDRREFRKNLHKAFVSMGGKNLYYR